MLKTKPVESMVVYAVRRVSRQHGQGTEQAMRDAAALRTGQASDVRHTAPPTAFQTCRAQLSPVHSSRATESHTVQNSSAMTSQA